MDELTIGDKIYISSKRAAAITGYAKDYVGQLCREGRVEATLVGRSWYVLESSIRAHRFGAEVAPSTPKKGKEVLPTWESPTYKADEGATVPPLERRSINLLGDAPAVAPVPAEEEKVPETVEDMQSAWREWFASRQEAAVKQPEEEPIEEEEVVNIVRRPDPEEVVYTTTSAEEESLEEEIYDPVPSTPEIEEVVPIKRAYDIVRAPVAEPAEMREERPASVPETRWVKPIKKRKATTGGKTSVAIKAALLSISGFAIAVTLIGSGLADRYTDKSGVEYSMLRFFAGVTIVE